MAEEGETLQLVFVLSGDWVLVLYYGARGGEACGVWGYILYASAWNLVVPESVCGCGVCREFHTVMVLSWGECAEQEREE